jgi:hypothetical protein
MYTIVLMRILQHKYINYNYYTGKYFSIVICFQTCVIYVLPAKYENSFHTHTKQMILFFCVPIFSILENRPENKGNLYLTVSFQDFSI